MQFTLPANNPNHRLKFQPSQSLPLRIRTEHPVEQVLVRHDAFSDQSSMRVSHTHKPHHSDCRENDVSDKLMRGGVLFLIFFSIAFIAIVVIILSVAFGRMADEMNKIDGNSVASKIDHALSHVVGAAENAETISSNAVQISALAREAAVEAQPKMLNALNESTTIMHQMKAFSDHPAWTVSAASLG